MDKNTEVKQVSNSRYVLKVTIYHIITYIVAGIIFSSLFNYRELYQLGNTAYFMRPFDSTSSFIGPVFQILRGILFGVICLLFRPYIIEDKHAFIKLFLIILVIGIINTPGPSPGSIEGIIYTQLPWQLHVFGLPEVIIQVFAFSYLVAGIDKKTILFPKDITTSLIAAIIVVICYSIGGVVLSSMIGVDVTSQAGNNAAYITLLIIGLIIFGITWFYLRHRKLAIAYYLLCYLILAVYPTVSNYMTDSIYKSPWTLVINAVPIVLIWLYLKRINK